MNYLLTRQLGLMMAAVALLLDALSKGWIVAHQTMLPLGVIRHFFSLVLAWNPGMSFSQLQTGLGPLFLGVMALVASVGFIHWMGEAREDVVSQRWHQLGLGLLTGGALGNLLDRVVHGAVVDFLLFYGKHWYFPVFNLADSAITLGVVMLLWDSVRRTLKTGSAAAPEMAANPLPKQSQLK